MERTTKQQKTFEEALAAGDFPKMGSVVDGDIEKKWKDMTKCDIQKMINNRRQVIVEYQTIPAGSSKVFCKFSANMIISHQQDIALLEKIYSIMVTIMPGRA
jgi:hypothetical protein